MARLLSAILDWLQSLLSIFSDNSSEVQKPPAQPITSDEKRPTVHVVRKLTKKVQASLKEETPSGVSEFARSFIADRWHWILSHPWTIVILVVVTAVIHYSERGAPTPWWVGFFQSARDWWAKTWEAYPVSIALLGLILLLFLFGIDWLRQIDNWLLRFWQWAKSHRQISTTLGVILLILVVYILSNANTWAFTSVEVWSEEDLGISGDKIAVHFRGDLNAIGTTSFDTLTVSAPSLPVAVTNAKSTLQDLSLEHCSQIMVGPKSFVAVGGRPPVSLPRLSRAQADDGTAGQISLGTTLGKFDLPLEGLIRLIFVYTAPNYRELSAQIVPASRTSETGAIRIIVTALDGSRWTVEGPRESLPQLINFLAHRIALDWKAAQTEQAADQVESADLALSMGNQAFAASDYTAALAYYRLAEWFRPDSAVIEIMLGLTHIQLSAAAQADGEAKMLLDKATRAFNRAQSLDPNNADLFPYLACLYQTLNQNDQAQQLLEAFNATLRPDSPDAKQERITELAKKPPLGPGRRLSIFAREAEANFDIYYISDDAARFALKLPYLNPFDNLTDQLQTLIAGEAPRQVFAVADGAYYLTADGLVSFFQPDRSARSVIDANHLQFARLSSGEFILGTPTDETELAYNNTGGIRQIFADTTDSELLFLVDRFGRILRLRVTQAGTGGLDVTLETVAEANVQQIYLDANALYVLKEDGAVWRISDPRTGNLQTARQLVIDTDNREITAYNGVIYMLRTNGNIWRYLDGEGVEGDLLKRIDAGVETSRMLIAPQGLFVLKNNGVLWLIRNPQNPGEADIEKLTSIPIANRVAIDVTGPNLISLERNEITGPELRRYDLPQSAAAITNQIAQQPESIPTLIPTSTPTPIQPTPTLFPTFTPLPTDTPLPTLMPTATATPTPAASTSTVISQTRPTDGAVEVLVTIADDPTNWFWIDQTEVTNRRYQICVDQGICAENADGYASLFYRANHPVVGVNWQQAQTYCAWVEGSLPTVSQWRVAASPDGRAYPWGDTGPSCQVAIINDACDAEEPGTRPVGSKSDGASRFGALDLVGSVWEWTATLGDKDDGRVMLGGSWSNPDGTPQGGFEAFNPANALSQGETLRANNLGFRCVRPYQPVATE
ncbi:MAG: SUMF1/EgtB/PvdO family nonheme iron enzyme [Anaerolineae bacterium]|nr:SUMF1/EgtB/PvdO family nonheme iron enzyme [Anaerolineae bacterium]